MKYKHILFLASGSSRRFGSNKLLYPLHGRPLYLWGLETLRSVVQHREDCTLTVVSRYEEIRRAGESLGIAAADSPLSSLGISHTIRAGIAALPAVQPEDYLLFAVADQPYITADSVEKLLKLAESGIECACLSYAGQPGNPALFSAGLLPELMALEGDTGGRSVLNRHRCLFLEAVSPRELEDIDVRPSAEG